MAPRKARTRICVSSLVLVGALAVLLTPATVTATDPVVSMFRARGEHVATQLTDGRVLLAGGIGRTAEPMASAELFDPVSGTVRRTGRMTTGRALPTATVLADGRVLVAGGVRKHLRAQATAELYDPATGRFTRTGTMMAPRSGHTATLLSDGRVLIAGGSDDHSDPAETLRPDHGHVSPYGTDDDRQVVAHGHATRRRPCAPRRRARFRPRALPNSSIRLPRRSRVPARRSRLDTSTLRPYSPTDGSC